MSHPPQTLRAFLLCRRSLSPDDRRLTRLLDFFGVSWTALDLDQACDEAVRGAQYCLLSSAPVMAEVLQHGEAPPGCPAWLRGANSVYLYGFQDTPACNRLLRTLCGDPEASLGKFEAPWSLSVTCDSPEMCGPLSGLRFPVAGVESEPVFHIRASGEEFRSIITAGHAIQFFSARCAGVPFYVSASSNIIDITERSATYFDVKKYACSAVPAAMYIRWAFRAACWTAAETSACLIIDDPPLTTRYGHLDFREALALMKKHGFATTIAFIPWNWRRTDRTAVELFRQNADRLSLCIHGCDHTGAEFASRSTALLSRRSKTANHRMKLLRERDGLHYDPAMVFPQGAFSPEVGRALKLNGFVAAVNTEVAPLDSAANETTIADLWSVANTRYGGFPIFSRRYPSHGVENFAFDGLLGKPCLVVGHHEAFRDHGRQLVGFIATLNALNWDLRWRTLGAALRHSYRVRRGCDETNSIQMFAEELVVENRSPGPWRAIVFKDEQEPECVRSIQVGDREVAVSAAAGQLQIDVTLAPGDSKTVRVLYSDDLELGPSYDGVAYEIKVAIRRYLSEFRDNYVSRSDFLASSAASLRRLLK